MTPDETDALIVGLGELMAKATPGPWEYRPDRELDDWGFIRGPADERGWRCHIATSRAGHMARFYDAGQHRANGTDPFEPIGKLIVEAINALPLLLADRTALMAWKEEAEKLLFESLYHLRLDDRAKDFHYRVDALLASKGDGAK